MSELRPPLRYLDAVAVEASLPNVATRVGLAARAMRALADGSAELPPKTDVHPRPAVSSAHAMPAWFRGADPDGKEDLLGIKWVTSFPANGKGGLPAIHGTAILNDPLTGRPQAILDAAPITAHRTAAVSGAAIRLFMPEPQQMRHVRVAVLGAGVQARSHLPVLAHLFPSLELSIHDRHPDRADSLAGLATETFAIASATPAPTARAALADADLIVTTYSFSEHRQVVELGWLPPLALIIAVDYDMAIPAVVARDAAEFLTDDRAQFLEARTAGWFAGYPDPGGTIGEALAAGRAGRDQSERAAPLSPGLVSHLGVGLADVIFADAILQVADARGLGTTL